MNGKILNFGEILLRICPDLSQDWVGAGALPFFVGGAELNVASALATWGLPSAYLSAMPQNDITLGILEHLKGRKVDLDHMLLQGNRLGLYYLPKGKDVKHAGVIYDRADSAFANLSRSDMDWPSIFKGVSWFHFSAICPAISQEMADICLDAVKEAKRQNIFVSLDLNYRSKLWKYGKQPIEVMPDLAVYSDLIMGNVWAAQQMLGTSLVPELKEVKESYARGVLEEQAKKTSLELVSRFEKCKFVANTFRFDYLEKGIQYFTTLFGEEQLLISEEYRAEEILDKVGSGDCFMAGLIYGLYQEIGMRDTLEFATAAAFDKLFIASDATESSVAGIQKRIKR
ncbi:sugar kinase [Sphingobacterium tabacisoli]|uniref:PfkB family carbohydrate kinase n=1 Tax=Sphingobacterium tabacisoli TaxID=2044855 RepID=A0ABW5KYK3_9SPHI|nr:sugar kinase [Sphingobacterium tabacisoli]